MVVGLTVALLLLQGSVTYKDKRINGWLLTPASTGCSAITGYGDGSDLFIRFDAGPDAGWIGFSDPKFKALEADRKYKLKVDFLKGGRLDTSWGEVKFTATKSADGSFRLLGKFDGGDLMDDLARSDVLGFFLGERLVDSFSLKGSAEVVAALRKCAALVERENPSDPFAE